MNLSKEFDTTMSDSKEHTKGEGKHPTLAEGTMQLKRGLWTVFDANNLADTVGFVWVELTDTGSTEYWYFRRGTMDEGKSCTFTKTDHTDHYTVKKTANQNGWYTVTCACSKPEAAPKP